MARELPEEKDPIVVGLAKMALARKPGDSIKISTNPHLLSLIQPAAGDLPKDRWPEALIYIFRIVTEQALKNLSQTKSHPKSPTTEHKIVSAGELLGLVETKQHEILFEWHPNLPPEKVAAARDLANKEGVQLRAALWVGTTSARTGYRGVEKQLVPFIKAVRDLVESGAAAEAIGTKFIDPPPASPPETKEPISASRPTTAPHHLRALDFKRPARRHSRRLLLTSAAGVVALLAGAIVYVASRPDDTPQEPASPLLATAIAFNSTATYWTTVFAQDDDSYQRFTEHLAHDGVENPSDPMDDPISRGGYALGGVRFNVNFEGNADHEITITNIKPVKVERRPPATGPIVVGPGGGTGPVLDHIGFILDSDVPVAFLVGSDDLYGKPYFEQHTISLQRGAKEVVSLEFTTQAIAATFNIEVDYELEGKTDRMIIKDKSGDPLKLRASASNCLEHPEIPPSDASKQILHDLQYSSIVKLPAPGQKSIPQQLSPETTVTAWLGCRTGQ